jgi:hypothetical protein
MRVRADWSFVYGAGNVVIGVIEQTDTDEWRASLIGGRVLGVATTREGAVALVNAAPIAAEQACSPANDLKPETAE